MMTTLIRAVGLRAASPHSVLSVTLLALLLLAPGCTQLKRWAYTHGDRDAWQQPERVVELLELEAGDRVGDLGAGGGYFTFRLADAVGPDGRVYALDVDEGMNEALAEDAAEKGYANVETVLTPYDSTGLDPGSLDLLFTTNTYHHLQDREQYFRNAAKVLAAGGRVAIIDFRHEGWFQKRHGTPSETIRSEMEAAGFRLLAEHDFLERQHFLVFAPPGS